MDYESDFRSENSGLLGMQHITEEERKVIKAMRGESGTDKEGSDLD